MGGYKMYQTVLAILVTFVISGCSTHSVKMYEGPERPVPELSTVRLWNPRVIVQSVDAKPVSVLANESHAYLIPGIHEFVVIYMYANSRTGPVTVKAETKAGHVYLFGFELHDGVVPPDAPHANITAYGIATAVSLPGAPRETSTKVTFFIIDKGKDYNRNCLDPRAAGNDC
jgi:hypothetical protein